MTELHNETIDGDRGITPVGQTDHARTTMLKRGFGALGLTAFAFLIILSTWKGDKPVTESARKLMIRQAAAFEPATEAPGAPLTTDSIPAAAPPTAPAVTRPCRTRCSKAHVAHRSWLTTGRSRPGAQPTTA